MGRHKNLRQPPTARKAKAPAAAHRQQAVARPHVLLEPTEPERDVDAVAELARDDLAGVLGEGRGWHEEGER